MAEKEEEKEAVQASAPKEQKAGAAEDSSEKSKRFKMQLIVSCIAVCAILFLPTTILLVAGMVPTIVVYLLDRTKKKSKSITIGALNLAGCAPLLLKLWTTEHSIESSTFIAFDPKSIILMYSMAVVGYMLDWALTGMIAAILYQKGLERRDVIERRQIELIERWGQEVTGNIPLDERGFPIAPGEGE